MATFFDQKRGWIDVTVKAEILCVGQSDQSSLTQSLQEKINLPNAASLAPISIKNACNKPILVWLRWRLATEEVVDGGPWTFKPAEKSQLTSDERRVMTPFGQLHYYAETADKSHVWQGGISSSPKLINGEIKRMKWDNVSREDGVRLLTINCLS